MTRDLLTEIVFYETEVWQALVSGEAERDAALLSDAFLGVYADGFATKADHVGQLSDGPTILTFSIDDARVMAVGADHALLSYCATFTRVGRDASDVMYVSSLWRRQNERWINVFSQDTAADRSALIQL